MGFLPPCADADDVDIGGIGINSANSTADVEYSDEAGNALCFSIELIFIEVSVIFLFANCCFGLFRALVDKRSTRDLAATESTHAQGSIRLYSGFDFTRCTVDS